MFMDVVERASVAVDSRVRLSKRQLAGAPTPPIMSLFFCTVTVKRANPPKFL